MSLGDPARQLCHQCARPRPLPVLRETLLVDRYDGDRYRLIDTRRELLFAIEAAEREHLDEIRIEHANHNEQPECEQGQCTPRNAEEPAQARGRPPASDRDLES